MVDSAKTPDEVSINYLSYLHTNKFTHFFRIIMDIFSQHILTH